MLAHTFFKDFFKFCDDVPHPSFARFALIVQLRQLILLSLNIFLFLFYKCLKN